MPNLFPHDPDVVRLQNLACTLGEFLAEKADFEPPRLQRTALVHPHCHQDAVIGMEAEKKLYERMGLEVEMSNAGCCGLAGSFGFEDGEKFEVSVAAGERKLAPKVRTMKGHTLLVADGFSCKTQIEHLTERRALHTAQVLQMALDQSRSRLDVADLPERHYPDVVLDKTPARLPAMLRAAPALGVGALVLSVARKRARRRRRSTPRN